MHSKPSLSVNGLENISSTASLWHASGNCYRQGDQIYTPGAISTCPNIQALPELRVSDLWTPSIYEQAFGSGWEWFCWMLRGCRHLLLGGKEAVPLDFSPHRSAEPQRWRTWWSWGELGGMRRLAHSLTESMSPVDGTWLLSCHGCYCEHLPNTSCSCPTQEQFSRTEPCDNLGTSCNRVHIKILPLCYNTCGQVEPTGPVFMQYDSMTLSCSDILFASRYSSGIWREEAACFSRDSNRLDTAANTPSAGLLALCENRNRWCCLSFVFVTNLLMNRYFSQSSQYFVRFALLSNGQKNSNNCVNFWFTLHTAGRRCSLLWGCASPKLVGVTATAIVQVS